MDVLGLRHDPERDGDCGRRRGQCRERNPRSRRHAGVPTARDRGWGVGDLDPGDDRSSPHDPHMPGWPRVATLETSEGPSILPGLEMTTASWTMGSCRSPSISVGWSSTRRESSHTNGTSDRHLPSVP